MFAKRLFQKAAQQLQQNQHLHKQSQSHQHQQNPSPSQSQSQSQSPSPQADVVKSLVDLQPRVTLHYGIPSTSSVLAFDPIQSLLAVGTLDGRIKVVGGDNIEALLVSPKQLPFKYLQFLQNEGFLASISNENDIQIWDLKHQNIVCTMQWDSNVTAFSVIRGTTYMYLGDENGMVFVLKYDAGGRKLIQLPYLVPAESVAEAAAISVPPHKSVVGVLPQPLSDGKRLLIAYEHGLLVLWDAHENQAVLVRGCKDCKLKDQAVVDLSKEAKNESVECISDDEELDKEISSLCWASPDGSVLAVGYVDGDILLWNLSSSTFLKNQQDAKLSNDSVMIQLSSSDRRLPVIVLHWSAARSHGAHVGQLYVYGGTEIGSEEVLTILSLDWSRGIQNVKCVGCTEITLNGSFADMVLVPATDETEGVLGSSPIILTNPGQLHFYDEDCLAALSHLERSATASPLPYEMAIPTVEPQMTVSKLGSVPNDDKFQESLLELVQAARHHDPANGNTRWPIYGGIPNRDTLMEDYHVKRIYVAGYRDGSVRLWDATSPAFSQIYAIEPEVKGVEIIDANAAVSALEICSITLFLAVGTVIGSVRLYNLVGVTDTTKLHMVSATDKQVCKVHQDDGPQCIALFSLPRSPIHSLKFVNSGARLAIGFESGQVAVIDTMEFAILNLIETISNSSPVVSLSVNTFSDSTYIEQEDSEPKDMIHPERSVIFVLTKDASVAVMDGAKGTLITSQSYPENKSTAISLDIIAGDLPVSEVSDEPRVPSPKRTEARETPELYNIQDRDSYSEDSSVGPLLNNSYAILCCENLITLYSLKSPIQISDNIVRKLDLAKPCSWTMVLRKDDRVYGLVVLYQTGVLEIRSLPSLEIIGESSLISLLRWSFKTNMDKTLSSTENGQITLVNGGEFAFISLLASENNFRIPQSLPCLHDEVLAAAADASINSSPDRKGTARGILDTVIKGLEGKHDSNAGHLKVDCLKPAQLEAIFSKPLSFESWDDAEHDQGVIELNIDDIDIDGPVIVSPSYQKPVVEERDVKPERERLFEGSSSSEKPRMRTREEIIAKYRKTPAGDAHAAASQARDKLAERGEKLEKMRERTEELQNGAEDFASMAAELAKRMENRKWWNMF